MFIHLVSVFASLAVVSSELKSQTFELPKLLIQSDQTYLQKNKPTRLSCQITAGWSEARMVKVQWFKDGTPIQEVKDFADDYTLEKSSLSINSVKQNNEGAYQCLADLHDIRLSNRQYVQTNLISPPLKIRRARITKFEKTTTHFVRALQNEVARLPCAGMPDVIPGPAEICFEKNGGDGRCFGEKNDKETSKYLATPTGLQIALVQETDNGSYFCVVKNRYLNITKRSPKAVILQVDIRKDAALLGNDDDVDLPDLKPRILFPTKGSVKPIVVDVVAGQDTVLECVFSNANVVWKKQNATMPPLSLTDDEKPFRQLWGNLRIRGVSQGDAGVYSCHGLNPLNREASVDDEDHPRAYYKLVVHAPTAVNLSLNQNAIDKSWQLSCLAMNLNYEIPMVYVNGTPLITAIEQMGVPSATNFYTNPVNVTMQVKRTFSGSVQCISRPAMEEAEIYGTGLERGRSENVYVVSNPRTNNDLIIQGPTNTTVEIGETVELTCLVQKAMSKFWTKRNGTAESYVKITGPRTKIVGANSLRISNAQPGDEGWYTCHVTQSNKINKAAAYLQVSLPTTTPEPITTTEPFLLPKKEENITIENLRQSLHGLEARVQWEVKGSKAARARIAHFLVELKTDTGHWNNATSVASHVTATSIKGLIPARYRFRVKAIRDDGFITYSAESDLFEIGGDIVPESPKIVKMDPISSTSIMVQWSHDAKFNNSQAKNFIIYLTSTAKNGTDLKRVHANETEAVFDSLKPLTDYTVQVIAENKAGKSIPSRGVTVKTLDASMENGLFDMIGRGIKQVIPGINLMTVLFVAGAALLGMLIILVCCIVFCNWRSRNEKATNAANGKFLDTSYRIFNEQKVHKSKLNTAANLFATDDIDECSPLKMPGDRRSLKSEHGFTINGPMPNLYGNIGEEVENDDHADAPNDPNYVNSAKITSQGIYGTTHTARCYSPDSGTSHEMLVPPFTSPGGIIGGPLMTSSPQRVIAYKCPDSLLYSPAGTASSSLGDTSSSGPRLTCDSPTNPPTDASDQGIRCGGSSRNSQISSNDGNGKFLHTFKAPHPNTVSMLGTFDRNRDPTIYGLRLTDD